MMQVNYFAGDSILLTAGQKYLIHLALFIFFAVVCTLTDYNFFQ